MTRLSPAAFLAAAVALVGAGWGSGDYMGKPKPVDPNILPVNYRADIVLNMKNLLIDPTNVKEAFISEPMLATGNKDERYTVCIRSNSRGYHREYLGPKDRIAYF